MHRHGIQLSSSVDMRIMPTTDIIPVVTPSNRAGVRMSARSRSTSGRCGSQGCLMAKLKLMLAREPPEMAAWDKPVAALMPVTWVCGQLCDRGCTLMISYDYALS